MERVDVKILITCMIVLKYISYSAYEKISPLMDELLSKGVFPMNSDQLNLNSMKIV